MRLEIKLATACAARGPQQCTPVPVGTSFEQKRFGTSSRRLAAAQPSWKHARIVHDEKIVGAKVFREIAEAHLREHAGRPLQNQQTCGVTRPDRLLRDALRGQVVVQIGPCNHSLVQRSPSRISGAAISAS